MRVGEETIHMDVALLYGRVNIERSHLRLAAIFQLLDGEPRGMREGREEEGVLKDGGERVLEAVKDPGERAIISTVGGEVPGPLWREQVLLAQHGFGGYCVGRWRRGVEVAFGEKRRREGRENLL